MVKNNIDYDTVASFGDEWGRYKQNTLGSDEHQSLFNAYFHIFPWDTLAPSAEGFDMGCGSRRWAHLMAPRGGTLNCIDRSAEALAVAKANLAGQNNVRFLKGGVSDDTVPHKSQDFGYSLGVLHHIPDTPAALKSCTALLKPGAPFLLYLYYRFDNRSKAYAALWRTLELVRSMISRTLALVKNLATEGITAVVYWPLARTALLAEKAGVNVRGFLLLYYRNHSIHTMRTGSRNRFGTPLKPRSKRAKKEQITLAAELKNIVVSDNPPFWAKVSITV